MMYSLSNCYLYPKYFCRVLTGHKSWSTTQIFLGADQNSVWRNILENHMTDESFMESELLALKQLMEANTPLTAYFSVDSMLYNSKPCELKILWESSKKIHQSFAFKKDSPLLPFFKYAYKKLRQTGTLQRISQKWKEYGKSLNCEQDKG